MRYERVASLLQLALKLASSREGLTIEDVQTEFAVSRRTAERMLDGVRTAFPHIDEAPSDDRKKRWRLPQNVLRGLVSANALELAELDASARRLRAEGDATGRADALETLAAKLRAVMQSAVLVRAEPDVEMLMEAEGTAIRPGPRPRVRLPMLQTIREALLSSRMIRLRYRTAASGAVAREGDAEPLGILHGQRPYLVVRLAGYPPNPIMIRLDRVDHVKILDPSFVRDFSLQAYAARSFGVFQEAPVKVCLRFSLAAAEDAAAYHFHSTQTLETLPDGRLLVRFEAGGLREMCFHLATWDDAVEILEPATLRMQMADWSRRLAAHHAIEPQAIETAR
jgi:predicted DNA-binding transcriptional regulator YafY